MPQYVAIGSYDASECPGANGKMREVWKKLLDGADGVGQKHGVKRVGSPVHLDPAHKVMVILEAPSQDAVQDALAENRLGQVQDIELYRATDLFELFKMAEGLPPLY